MFFLSLFANASNTNYILFLFVAFTSTGHYKTNFSFDSQLLSEEVEVSLTPQVWSSVNGSMRVGSATFALVVIEGTLIDATLPLTMKQNFSTWPLVAR